MKSGQFSLQVINAETREPMKEFQCPEGKLYVEAEPDLEYFLRIQTDRSVGGVLTKAAIHVDGTSLGYDYHLSTTAVSEDLGLWKCVDGAHSFVSLKFVLKRTRAVADAAAAASMRPPIGNISVSFYECQLGQSTYIQEDVDSTKRLPSEKDASSEFSAQSQPGAKKAFASVAGGTMAKEAPDTKPAKSNGGGNKKPRLQQKYVRGRHIQTVTLHYTSAMGFVQLGIM